jgi:hypothetical protein
MVHPKPAFPPVRRSFKASGRMFYPPGDSFTLPAGGFWAILMTFIMSGEQFDRPAKFLPSRRVFYPPGDKFTLPAKEC